MSGTVGHCVSTLNHLRRHGPFEPHRLTLEDLEYTTMRDLEERLADRWQPLAAEPELPRQPTPG